MRPFYGLPGGTPEFCARHAHGGRVDLRAGGESGSAIKPSGRRPGSSSRACREEGCPTRPTYGVKGHSAREYCAKHAKPGMVDVATKRWVA